jgi:DNA-binding MarR family transcriptional regulator
VGSSREVIARRIHIHILEQGAKALARAHSLMHLPFQLVNLETLLLELPIDQEKVCKAFGEEVIASLNLVREGLAMVPVEL